MPAPQVPATIAVRVDRDAVPLDDGRRPWRRRVDVPGGTSLKDLLAQLGLPLEFTDGHGVWTVVRGTSGADDGVHILAVVAQTRGEGGRTGCEVHLISGVAPALLADEDGELDLYYRSTPGPVAGVVAAARRGEAYTRPPPNVPEDNAAVHAALTAYGQEQSSANALNVLRQALGGQLVLDATGSSFDDDAHPGGQRLVINFIRAPDGSRALPAFTHHHELVRFREEDDGGPLSIVQPADRVLAFFVSDPETRWLYINPAGPPLGIRRDQVLFALQAGHNVAVKNALARLDLTRQDLFDALRADDGVLFVGDRGRGGALRALELTAPGGRPALPAFTSAVEAAAWDQSMRFRRMSVGAVLELLLERGSDSLLINPGGPSASLSAVQVRHILGRPMQARA
ncbi:SseB family protein [Georgenia sp. AZ-5]|uniref:SseB family protein n=1 Tax=Georgenia sp. AZ-5 TaxID=3367526 RepID=UPI0037541681